MATPLSTFLAALTHAAVSGSFVKLSLSKPLPGGKGETEDLKSIDVRPILVKREVKLSFTYHYKTRDIVKNFTPHQSQPQLMRLLEGTFTTARLFTLDADTHLTRHATAKDSAAFSVTVHPPSVTVAPSLTHDKTKERLVKDTSRPWLRAVGLTDADGRVLKSAQDKFRQINKYLEVLDGLIRQLPADKPLRIADMGSGKGYLTFALYDHLTYTLKRKAVVIGVEYRKDMVDLCNQIAAECEFTNLGFVKNSIEGYDCSETDVVIALHACDTATDDAIAKAANAGTSLIVVAPCCHKQIRRQMETAERAGKPNAALGFLLRFGTFTERTAEMVTDGLRAQFLELAGYDTNAFEFISDAHTPKNVMITALRREKPLPEHEKVKIIEAIAEEKHHFGIRTHYLETKLDY